MKFQYNLNGSGWAEGFIEVNSQRCEFNPSYLTNALGDLLDSLVELLTYEPNPKKKIFNTVFFDWNEEPTGLEWVLTRLEDEKVSLFIKSFDDIDLKKDEQGTVVINTICTLSELITEITKEVDNLLTKHGIVGYRETWEMHDFPLSSYLKLKHFLNGDTQFQVKYIPGEQKGYGGYHKSDLNFELSLIIGKPKT
ncbi:hypothetical protein [Peribacillus huizhouensis]|uniref:Uncharacterized protein n=1 Tax=Peribacillus huizhouensis TaxID=1501239 RepID=A0ABR6CXN9_9BACI|nr:hypothetical protein [Peribacillus huizhouensis]MBA9029458.1 hypothetical protein [Peribacillus huizhouensis]